MRARASVDWLSATGLGMATLGGYWVLLSLARGRMLELLGAPRDFLWLQRWLGVRMVAGVAFFLVGVLVVFAAAHRDRLWAAYVIRIGAILGAAMIAWLGLSGVRGPFWQPSFGAVFIAEVTLGGVWSAGLIWQAWELWPRPMDESRRIDAA